MRAEARAVSKRSFSSSRELLVAVATAMASTLIAVSVIYGSSYCE